MSILLNTQNAFLDASVDTFVRNERKKADIYFKRTKRINSIATVVLCTAAALTLAILIYILGFIVYKGFRSDNVIESDFLNYSSAEAPLPWYPGDAVLIANPKVRIKDINYTDLELLLNGKPSNWGNINGQDMKVHPYILQSAYGIFGKNTTFRKTAVETAAAVENQEGAFGLIPASDAATIKDSKVNIIPVQPLAAAVNPAVFEIENNIKLRYVDNATLKSILRGEISNWNEAGGIDLPLRLIIPPEGSYEYNAYLEISGLSADEIPVNGIRAREEDYPEMIKSVRGSIGLMLKQQALEQEVATLKYRFRKTGRNLQLWFLLEEPRRAGRVGGVSSIIINTVYMILLTVLFSTPLGIGAAVYLTEYASQGRLVKVLRMGTETLAGIPSVIFGLFGFIVFVGYMHLGIGLLSGTLTLTLMILPTIVRTSEEAIKAVPKSFRAGSLALGAGKWQTIRKVVIPAASPGILTGVILAIGRAVGETAALLFTMGFDYRRVENLSTSARVLSTHLYQLVKEGISFDRAFATATILIFIVLFVNVVSTKLVVRKY